MSRRLFKSRVARLLVVVVAALAVAAGAFAYWTASGSGSGSATAGTTQAVTISAGVTPTSKLYPGGSGDVTVSIDNPNTTSVHLPSLQLDTSQGGGTGFAVDSAHQSAGCTATAAALSFTPQTNSSAGFVVPAKVGATDGILAEDLAGAVSMGAGAANACQGATFTVYLKVGS